MKRKIRLTESDLHRVIKESVNKVLNEDNSRLSSYEKLENAYELLTSIMNSSFIPFSSPSPSDSEKELRKTIIEAARLINKSIHLCNHLGYHQPIAHLY